MSRLKSRGGEAGAGGGATVQRSVAPGKSSRTDALSSRRREPAEASGASETPGADHALGEMSSAFGRSFDDVQLHTDDDAAARTSALGADAFTAGRDVYFAPGAFDPGSHDGKRVLAHELAHVAQQEGAAPTPQGFSEPQIGERGSPFEQEAHAAADAVLAGRRPKIELSTSQPTAMRDEDPPEKLDYNAYVKKYAPDMAKGVAAELAGYEVEANCPFASWKASSAPVITNAVQHLAMVPSVFTQNLVALLSPDMPFNPIDRGRGAGDDGKSDDKWAPAVATELANILKRRFHESIERMVPRYVRATNQAYNKANPPGPVAGTGNGDIDNPPLPVPDDVIWTAPLDRYVGPALFNNVKCDLRNYQKAHPDEKDIQQPRVVKWEFAAAAASSASEGKNNWVRVTETLDPPPSAEDVALSIFGTSSKASYIIPAPPMFGFMHPEELIPYNYEQWQKLPGNDGSSDPSNIYKYDPAKADPAKQILSGTGANAAALAQAQGATPTGQGDKASVAKRIRATSLVVDGLIATAKPIGGADVGSLTGLKTRLDDRAKEVDASQPTTSGADLNPWDGQSAMQLEIVGACAPGLDAAAKNWAALAAGGGSPPSFLADPIRALTAAFIGAASVSDLIDTAHQRLAQARTTLRNFPVDVMEGLLSYVRSLVEAASSSSGWDMGEVQGGANLVDMRKKEDELRARCTKLRDTIVSDPSAASIEMKKLEDEIRNLQDDASVVALIAKETELSYLLHDLQSKLGTRVWARLNPWSTETRSKNQMYDDASSQLLHFENELIAKVVKPGKTGDHATAHANLIAVQGEYKNIFPDVAKLIDEQESREKWIKIGAMIGAGILSAGFADALAVTAAADLGAEGAGLAALKTGAEAAAFTAITTTTLEKDPTVAGVIASFVQNAVTFGLVGKAMKDYEAAFPEFSKTLAGKGGAVTGMFMTHCVGGLVAADAKKFLETGQHLSEEEMKDSILEGVLVTIGTLIGERVTHHMLESMHLGHGPVKAKLDAINSGRDKVKTESGELKPGAKIEQAKAVIEHDGNSISDEKAFLDELDGIESDPAKAKAAGASDADVTAIKAAKGERDSATTDIDKGKALQLAASLKPIAPGLFTSEGSAKFDELLAAHDKIKSHVTVTGEKGNRIAVIEADGQTIRVMEDETGAIGAKGDKPVDSTVAKGTADAVAQRAKEKTYTDNKTAILGRLKKTADGFEIDGSGASLAEVTQKMRELGWQTMEIVEGAEVTLPDGSKAKLRTARYEAHPDPATGNPPYETAAQAITVKETVAPDPKTAAPVDKAKYEAAISAIRARQVPNPMDLPPGTGNLEGTVKLEKLGRDAWLDSDPEGQKLLSEFHKMLGDRLKAYDDPAKAPLTDLNGEITKVMSANGADAKPMFMNRGPAMTSGDAAVLGDLDRAMDWKGIAANKCITDAYYKRLLATPENDPAWKLPAELKDTKFDEHVPHMVTLMQAHPPDVNTELDASKPIGRPGSPQWWGAASDAGTNGPLPASLEAAKYAKAVAAANLEGGGVLFRIPASEITDGKIKDPTGGTAVARRPTMFDALWQTQFNPNPDAAATYGKTTPNPTDTSVAQVREVVLPTINISQAHARVLIK